MSSPGQNRHERATHTFYIMYVKCLSFKTLPKLDRLSIIEHNVCQLETLL
mgnify:CR=1 FL=1